jgi:hypothetical protein
MNGNLAKGLRSQRKIKATTLRTIITPDPFMLNAMSRSPEAVTFQINIDTRTNLLLVDDDALGDEHSHKNIYIGFRELEKDVYRLAFGYVDVSFHNVNKFAIQNTRFSLWKQSRYLLEPFRNRPPLHPDSPFSYGKHRNYR